MFTESAEDLAELTAEFHELGAPANADERFLVDTLVDSEWRLRRVRRVEEDLWLSARKQILAQNPGAFDTLSSGDAFAIGNTQSRRKLRGA